MNINEQNYKSVSFLWHEVWTLFSAETLLLSSDLVFITMVLVQLFWKLLTSNLALLKFNNFLMNNLKLSPRK